MNYLTDSAATSFFLAYGEHAVHQQFTFDFEELSDNLSMQLNHNVAVELLTLGGATLKCISNGRWPAAEYKSDMCTLLIVTTFRDVTDSLRTVTDFPHEKNCHTYIYVYEDFAAARKALKDLMNEVVLTI